MYIPIPSSFTLILAGLASSIAEFIDEKIPIDLLPTFIVPELCFIVDVPSLVYIPIVFSVFTEDVVSATSISAVFTKVWLPFKKTPKVCLPAIFNFPLLVTVLVLFASE